MTTKPAKSETASKQPVKKAPAAKKPTPEVKPKTDAVAPEAIDDALPSIRGTTPPAVSEGDLVVAPNGTGETSVSLENPDFSTEVANLIANPVTPVTAEPAVKADPAKVDLVEVEETTAQGSLSDTFFDLVPSTTSPSESTLVLKMYGPGCLECAEIVEDAPSSGSKLPACHFSKGNAHCPASSARIEFVGERVVTLRKIRKAQETKDSNRLLRLMGELESRPLAFKNAVLVELGLLSKDQA